MIVLCYGLRGVIDRMIDWLLHWLVLRWVPLIVDLLWLMPFIYRLRMSEVLDLEGLKIEDLVLVLVERRCDGTATFPFFRVEC